MKVNNFEMELETVNGLRDVQFCGYYGTHFELKDGNP
jgi:hypothetical protein